MVFDNDPFYKTESFYTGGSKDVPTNTSEVHVSKELKTSTYYIVVTMSLNITLKRTNRKKQRTFLSYLEENRSFGPWTSLHSNSHKLFYKNLSVTSHLGYLYTVVQKQSLTRNICKRLSSERNSSTLSVDESFHDTYNHYLIQYNVSNNRHYLDLLNLTNIMYTIYIIS